MYQGSFSKSNHNEKKLSKKYEKIKEAVFLLLSSCVCPLVSQTLAMDSFTLETEIFIYFWTSSSYLICVWEERRLLQDYDDAHAGICLHCYTRIVVSIFTNIMSY